MQVIDKFILNNANHHKYNIRNAKHREIYYKQGKSSINLLEKMQVIDKFIINNACHR